MTRKTAHLHGVPDEGTLEVMKVPDPETVEVVEQEGAIYLLRFDAEGQCIADTWHESVERAKAQARFEFGIEDSDWQEAESGH